MWGPPPWESNPTLTYFMLRNGAAGPEICLPGLILAGLLPGMNRNRPSGLPKAGRRADFGAFPVAVRPKSGRTARNHYCITSNIGRSFEEVPQDLLG